MNPRVIKKGLWERTLKLLASWGSFLGPKKGLRKPKWANPLPCITTKRYVNDEQTGTFVPLAKKMLTAPACQLQLKCWVLPGEEETKRKEKAAMSSLPPSMTGSSVSLSSAASAPVPPLTNSRSGVSFRYAAVPNLATRNEEAAAAQSVLAGLKPPTLFGGSTLPGSAPAGMFKPLPVLKSSSQPSSAAGSKTTSPKAHQFEAVPSWREAAASTRQSKKQLVEPEVVEILSFWHYYRGCGFDEQAMKEWVRLHYGNEYEHIDANELLAQSDIMAVVEEYIILNAATPLKQDVKTIFSIGETKDAAQGEVATNGHEVGHGYATPAIGATPTKHDYDSNLAAEEVSTVLQEDFGEGPPAPSGMMPPRSLHFAGQTALDAEHRAVIDDGFVAQNGDRWQDEGGNRWQDEGAFQHEQAQPAIAEQAMWNPEEGGNRWQDEGAFQHELAQPAIPEQAMWNPEEGGNQWHDEGAFQHEQAQPAIPEQAMWNPEEGGNRWQDEGAFQHELAQPAIPEQAMWNPEEGGNRWQDEGAFQHELAQPAIAEQAMWNPEEGGNRWQDEGAFQHEQAQPAIAEQAMWNPEEGGNRWHDEGAFQHELAQPAIAEQAMWNPEEGGNRWQDEGDFQHEQAQPAEVPVQYTTAIPEPHTCPLKEEEEVKSAVPEYAVPENAVPESAGHKPPDSSAGSHLQIAELEQIIIAFKEKSVDLEKLLSIAHQESSTLEQELSTARAQADEQRHRLQEQLSSSQSHVIDKERAMASMEAKIEELEAAVSSAQVHSSEQEKALTLSQNRVAELQGHVAQLTATIDTLTTEFEDLKNQYTAYREESEERTADHLTSLEEQCEELATALAEQRESFKIVEEKLLEQIGSLEEGQGAFDAEKAALLAELERVRDESGPEIDDLKLQLEMRDEAVESLRSTVTDLQTQLNDAQDMYTSKLTQAHQAAEARLLEREGDIRAQMAHEKDTEIEAVKVRLASMEAEASAANHALLEKNEDTECKLREVEKKFALAKKKVAIMKEEKEALISASSAAMNSLEEVETLKRQLAESYASRDEEIGGLRSELQQARDLQARLLGDVDGLQHQLEEMRGAHATELSDLEEENLKLMDLLGDKQEQLEEMMAEIAELRSRQGRVDEEHADVVLELEKVVAQNATRVLESEQSVVQARERNEELEAALHEMSGQVAHYQNIVSQVDEMEQMLADRQRAVAEAEERLAGALEALAIETARAEAAEAALMQQPSEDSQAMAAEVQAVLHAKEEEVKKYKIQLVKAKKLRTADAEKIAQLQAEAAKGKDNEGLKRALAERDAHIEELHKELESLLAQLEAATPTVRGDADALRASLAEAEGSLSDALASLGQEEAKVEKLVSLLVENGVQESIVYAELDEVEAATGWGEDGEEGQPDYGGMAAQLPPGEPLTDWKRQEEAEEAEHQAWGDVDLT